MGCEAGGIYSAACSANTLNSSMLLVGIRQTIFENSAWSGMRHEVDGILWCFMFSGSVAVWAPWHWEDAVGPCCCSPHGVHLYPCVRLWAGAEVHWRGISHGARTLRHGQVSAELVGNAAVGLFVKPLSDYKMISTVAWSCNSVVAADFFLNKYFHFWGCTSGGVDLPCYLHACQVRDTVGDSGLCCWVCVTSFKHWLTPLCVEFTFFLILFLRDPWFC